MNKFIFRGSLDQNH